MAFLTMGCGCPIHLRGEGWYQPDLDFSHFRTVLSTAHPFLDGFEQTIYQMETVLRLLSKSEKKVENLL